MADSELAPPRQFSAAALMAPPGISGADDSASDTVD